MPRESQEKIYNKNKITRKEGMRKNTIREGKGRGREEGKR